MRVKICGITRVEDAVFAEKAGADAIGVVMYSGNRAARCRRKAREIFDAVGPFVTRVVVTHTESEEELKKMIALRPDAIQISHPFVFRTDPGARVLRVIGRGDNIPTDCDAVIVDDSMGAGTGIRPGLCLRQWQKHQRCRSFWPVGSTPENVGDAIRQMPALRGRCRKRRRDRTGNKRS